MKAKYYLLLFFGFSTATSLSGAPSASCLPIRMPALFADEESKEDEEPSDAVIRKLAAMMPEQTFKRGEKTISKGGVAPEGTTVYPVKILNADGSLAFDANFFQEAGKWALFDNHGNVARMTE
jgi:hypothetical protein